MQYLKNDKLPDFGLLIPYTLHWKVHCTDIQDLVCTDIKNSYRFQKWEMLLQIDGERSIY